MAQDKPLLAVGAWRVSCGSSPAAPQKGEIERWCGRVWPCPSTDACLVHGAVAWLTPLSLPLLSHCQPDLPVTTAINIQ